MESREVLADKDIDVTKLQEMELKQIIEFAAAKDQKVKETTAELDILKAELQRRAENELEEKNIKFTEFFGTVNSYVNVSYAQKLEVLNMPKVKELLGDELVKEKIQQKPPEIKYEFDRKFKQALIAVITGDYSDEFTIDRILDDSGWKMDERQRSLILKKLKGEYAKDLDMLRKTLGIPELEADEELYYIYKIKNWELISAFFPTDKFEAIAEEIKKYAVVDETPKIELKYSKEVYADGIKGNSGTD